MHRLTDKGSEYLLELVDFRNMGRLSQEETFDKIVLDTISRKDGSFLHFLSFWRLSGYGGFLLDSWERLLDSEYIEEVG